MEVYDESVAPDLAEAPPGYSPDLALGALETLRPRIERSVARPRLIRFADAAVACSRLHASAGVPELATRLARLPPEEFQPGLLGELAQISWALWHLDLLSAKPLPTVSKARVPAALWDSALRTRREMLEVVEFGLRSVDGIEAELADIRRGSGYLDAARDLLRLAEMYRDYGSILAGRLPQDFKATTADTAGRLADELRVALGLGSVTTPSDETGRRLWGLTVSVFGEVRAALQYLLRNDPVALSALPNLSAPRRSTTRTVNDPPTPA
jgi:hypothetical protein